MITVHLIFNAHIDPIWLWPWSSGLDTLLATCRSACDRLDAHPDLHFVRGEAWAYREVERIDPALFRRICDHVKAGRWHIVGGWWLQPDCNGPGYVGFEQQVRLGREYFEEKFGLFPRTGYNVDSFGHAATLPGLMRAHGQDRYVFMRPQEHEMTLPARLFRWRGYADGPEVTAFRIARAYTTRNITVEHVQAACEGLPEGVSHTMCFVGFGDHGGGPTECQIAWVREHMNAIPGCRLVFSSVDAFFDAVEPVRDRLPLVVGELQHHSVGCYSVHRPVKVGVHRAEQRLVQADIVRRHDPAPEAQAVERLKEAWRWVCFGHFHDTFGGTCIPSAYEQVHAQLGLSYATADEIIQHGVRRIMNRLPDDSCQRIVLFNASDRPYAGYAIHEPWLEAEHWQPHWRLIDESGRPVPHQRMDPECLVPDDYLFFLRLAFPVRIEPAAMLCLRIDKEGGRGAPPPASRVTAAPDRIATDENVAVGLAGAGELRFGDAVFPLPRLQLIDDPTDTWTHEVSRYDGAVVAEPAWETVRNLDTGPLMASIQLLGSISRSELMAEYRVWADEPFVEYHLRVYWNERHRLLKLTLPMPAPLGERVDGIPGGTLSRPPDGLERPVCDHTLLPLADGRTLGVVLPDVYALDALPEAVRLTLLRSPKMAHHWPYAGRGARAMYADQGVHEFRFRFYGGPAATSERLAEAAAMLHRPLVAADLTRGMPPVKLTPFIASNLAT